MNIKKILIISGGIVLLFLIALLAYLNLGKPFGIQNESVNIGNKVILKVGDENIYQKDMDYLVKSYPGVVKDKEAVAKAKLIEDSIILQAGSKDGLLTLSPSFYNSPTKDYTLRFSTIDNLKLKINTTADRIQGSVITLWFMNGSIGPLGYEKSKELAFSKISKVYSEVKAGRLSMEDAAKRITDDTSLGKIDTAYKLNAYFVFDAVKGEKISFSKEFNDVLWKLGVGEVSSIFTASDFAPSGSKVEAAFLFGKVTNRQSGKGIANFDDWLVAKQKLYEVKSI